MQLPRFFLLRLLVLLVLLSFLAAQAATCAHASTVVATVSVLLGRAVRQDAAVLAALAADGSIWRYPVRLSDAVRVLLESHGISTLAVARYQQLAWVPDGPGVEETKGEGLRVVRVDTVREVLEVSHRQTESGPVVTHDDYHVAMTHQCYHCRHP